MLCIGDLYGAIGSPVRMARTVIVGKRKDLVQRILYVLTYFLRCSELQENQLTWSEKVGKGEQALRGSKITSSLEKGEVEESDYVVVSVRNEPALVPPVLPQKSAGTAMKGCESCFGPTNSKENHEGILVEQCLEASSCLSKVSPPKGIVEDVKKGQAVADSEAVFGGLAQRENLTAQISDSNQNGGTKQLFVSLSAVQYPESVDQRYATSEKVTFQIGSSTSPESDLEVQRKEMDGTLGMRRDKSKAPCFASSPPHITLQAQREKSDFAFKPRARQKAGKLRGSTVHQLLSQQSVPSSSKIKTVHPGVLEEARSTCCENLESGSLDCATGSSTDVQDSSQAVTEDVPCGDTGSKHCFRMEENIPRNESSDSALGESDDEGSAYITDAQPVSSRSEELSEVELALPR